MGFEDDHVTTIGVDFKCKEVARNNRQLKIQIWDTAGQERFNTITPAYYKGAMGVLFVYDITDKRSFDRVETWMEQLDKHGDEGANRILVANKLALSAQRKVTSQEGEELAARYGIAF